jgi:hypothetical protein
MRACPRTNRRLSPKTLAAKALAALAPALPAANEREFLSGAELRKASDHSELRGLNDVKFQHGRGAGVRVARL